MSKPGFVLLIAAVGVSCVVVGMAANARPPVPIIGFLAGAQSLPAAATAAGAPDGASLAAGKQTFTQYCAACHGAKGTGGSAPEGGKAPRDLSQSAFQDAKTDAQLYSVVHDGVPPDFYMEAWGDRLSDTQIRNVVHYVRTLRAPSKVVVDSK